GHYRRHQQHDHAGHDRRRARGDLDQAGRLGVRCEGADERSRPAWGQIAVRGVRRRLGPLPTAHAEGGDDADPVSAQRRATAARGSVARRLVPQRGLTSPTRQLKGDRRGMKSALAGGSWEVPEGGTRPTRALSWRRGRPAIYAEW